MCWGPVWEVCSTMDLGIQSRSASVGWRSEWADDRLL